MKKIIFVLFTILFINNPIYADAGSKTIIDGYASTSDYKTAVARTINDNDADTLLDRANVVLCIVSLIKIDQFVNQTYRAFIDPRKCGSTDGGEVDITVSTQRANNNAPQETYLWFTSDAGTTTGWAYITADTSNNLEIWTAMDDSHLVVNPNFVSDAYLGREPNYDYTGQTIIDRTNSSGRFVFVGSEKGDRRRNIGEIIDYAYNDDYLYIKTTNTEQGTRTQNGESLPYTETTVANQCLSRQAPEIVARIYNIYDYNDGSLKTLNRLTAGVASRDSFLELELTYKKFDAQNPKIDIAEGTYTARWFGPGMNFPSTRSNLNTNVSRSSVIKTFNVHRAIPDITLKDGTLLTDKNTGKKYITKAVRYSRFYYPINLNNCTTLVGITPNFPLPDPNNIDTSKVPKPEDKPDAKIIEIL